jgi:uncharacterized protein YfiM (DUF2279 family)
MSKLLSDLVAQLEADVPAEGGVPSTTQYENAIKDAVQDFSERCGVEQISTLTIVSGTTTYTLPADFLRMIRLETIADLGEGVLHSAQGLIPVSTTWCEKYTFRNGQITIYPIPRYSMARDFHYKAAWIGTNIEADGSIAADIDYETMGDREARIVLLKAKALASTKKANAQASDGIKYSFGAVSEDLSGASASYQKDAETFESEYLDACKNYNGQFASYG